MNLAGVVNIMNFVAILAQANEVAHAGPRRDRLFWRTAMQNATSAATFFATDIAWPSESTPAGQRRAANMETLSALEVLHKTVILTDVVWAENASWRFFTSPAPPLPGLQESSFGLVLAEHLWPMEWRDKREKKWHANLLHKLVAQWPSCFIVMVQRDKCSNVTPFMDLPRKRTHIVKPVIKHYTAQVWDANLQLHSDIKGQECDGAIVVYPRQSTEFSVAVAERSLSSNELFIPSLCREVMGQGRSVVQFGAWSLESTTEIASVMYGKPERPTPFSVST